MAFSAFISSALTTTTVDDVRRVFEQLDVGVIDKIDTKDYHGRNGRSLRKFWIHFSSVAENENAKKFQSRLLSNDERMQNDLDISSSDIPRIVYGTRRDGSDMYWYVYYCKTPAERLAEQESRIAVRIEM
jgi:hypothetical protein